MAIRCGLLTLLGTLAACGATATPINTYRHALATKEAAARAVLDALAAHDRDRLLALAVSEEEFGTLVWPALPASRPEVGMPLEYVRADTFAKSRGHVDRLLQIHGGEPFQLERVTFGGQETEYGAFRIHPDTTLAVIKATGAQTELRAFGSMIETPDGWKVFTYIVD